jgi:hypothetical protein
VPGLLAGAIHADRGHLIPNLSGGELGPNIFRQDRSLNRGWSQEGRRFRAPEREAAAIPGTFYFGHLLYEDDTAYPVEINRNTPWRRPCTWPTHSSACDEVCRITVSSRQAAAMRTTTPEP